MAYTKRNLEELNIMDDFLLNAITTDPEVGEDFCRVALSTLLQREIGPIQIITQRTLPARTPTLRGIRMDVEVLEELHDGETLPAMNIYDLEPHLQNNLKLPRHNRFYQAKIDSRYVKSGERDFSGMPNLYVLTILDYDPFGYDYMMYSIANQCREVPELQYDDGLQYIYFYTKGTCGGSPAIKNMLNYFRESTQGNVVDDATKKVHEYVKEVKTQPEVRDAYMTFDDMIYFQRKDAAKEAKEVATLNTKIQDICELLEDYGPIPEELTDRLNAEKDPAVLSKWLKLAARANSIEEFIEKIS